MEINKNFLFLTSRSILQWASWCPFQNVFWREAGVWSLIHRPLCDSQTLMSPFSCWLGARSDLRDCLASSVCLSSLLPFLSAMNAQVCLRLCLCSTCNLVVSGANPTRQKRQDDETSDVSNRTRNEKVGWSWDLLWTGLKRMDGDNTGWNDWGWKQRSIYLYPRESRQPWKSWLSLHRKSVTCYSQAKLSQASSVGWLFGVLSLHLKRFLFCSDSERGSLCCPPSVRWLVVWLRWARAEGTSHALS